jgi:integrase
VRTHASRPGGSSAFPRVGSIGLSPAERYSPSGKVTIARQDWAHFMPRTAMPARAAKISRYRTPASPKALAIWFLTLYRELGFKGASSHSGRRTFITKAAKRCIEGGGSLRDVQQLAGHSSLATTQRYIEGSSDAKRRIVDLIS